MLKRRPFGTGRTRGSARGLLELDFDNDARSPEGTKLPGLGQQGA